jgi:hypothetical protein
MNTKMLVGGVVALLVVGGGSFYAGMQYSQRASQGSSSSPQDRAARFQQFGGGAGRGGRNGGGGFTAGEIIAKDDKSITIKMTDGSSKIVFYTSQTPTMKSVSGAVSDLSIGEQVTITGSANQDGSVTAQSIQIRPAGTTRGPSGVSSTVR